MVQSKPWVIGVLAGWFVLVAIILIVNLCGCQQGGVYFPRSLRQQYDQAVAIGVICADLKTGSMTGWYGSGVIVSEHVALTAAHVATLPKGQACVMQAQMIDGTTYDVTPFGLEPDNDLGSIYSEKAFSPTYPITYGSVPMLGDTICEATAWPHRVHRCGEAGMLEDSWLPSTMLVEPGNSGSGVYDKYGQLIAITVHLSYCSGNQQYCGSDVSLLAGHMDDLLQGIRR